MKSLYRFFVILFLVIPIFSFSVFASSVPDFSSALVYIENTIALGEIYLYPPLFVPVDGVFYRLYALDSSNNTVIVDVVAQCIDGSVLDPVSGCEYLYVPDDDVCVFWFPMYSDSQVVTAKCALFPVAVPDVPVGESFLLTDLGSISAAVLSNSASLGATIASNPFLLFTCGFLFIGGCVGVFGRFTRRD